MKMKVQSVLLYGKESAIPSKDLVELLGFGDTRHLQKQIERERAAGAVILPFPIFFSGGIYERT